MSSDVRSDRFDPTEAGWPKVGHRRCASPLGGARRPPDDVLTAMAWLVTDGRVLASAEIAADRRQRTTGLLRRDGVDGALVLTPCRWIHTIGMRFDLDVAYLDCDGLVVKTLSMRANRIGIPVPSARTVIEAECGAFARWGLRVGDQIEIRD